MKLIIKNISCLVTCKGSFPKKKDDMKNAGIIENGYVIVEKDKIKAIGQGSGYKLFLEEGDKIIDGNGKTLTPGLVDCHTHIVYSGSREKELSMKLNKVSYLEILSKGGGILNTVRNTRDASFDELVRESTERLDLMLLHGTTTIESKSGYGLDRQSEIKILEVNRELDSKHPIDIVSTYLGAHAMPMEYKDNREAYLESIIEKDIPWVVENNLAEFIDVFCEEGVFTVEESRRVLLAGKRAGLKSKIHADEIKSIGGAELSGELKAISAEHLVAASDKGIKAMADNNVVAVLLPSTSFYLMLNHYANARKMINNGVIVALATDCNPGTSPNESLQLTMMFGCFGMKMMPEEIINAVTINAACAIGREKSIGSIEVGKKADLVLFDSKNLDYLIYHIGSNSVNIVIKDGNIVVEKGSGMNV
ncbi:imidazolonepropionase [Clostridium sediminicola]|uniref:imidazolonepropionase n=1 Tax=Clostridium sediminicola TaxID=3114879 RepID=UPI0031F27D5D